MKQKTVFYVLVFITFLIAIPGLYTRPAQAQGGTAYDLIAAVNQLRASNGLAALQIDNVRNTRLQ